MLLPSAFYVLLRYPAVTKVTTLVKQNYSQKYHRISIVFTFVLSFGLDRLTLHIVKVFFASPYWKMWKFSQLKDARNNTHFRIDTCGRAHSACPDIPYLSECGVLCRLFQLGSFHNLLLDKRKSAPHFLCIYMNHLGAGCAYAYDYESELTRFLRGYYL